MAQLTDRRGGQTSSGRMLSDSVTEFCRGIVADEQLKRTTSL